MELQQGLSNVGIRKEKLGLVRTIGGRRRIPESEIKRILGLREERAVLGYVRVSSSTQKDDLERQRQLVANYAKERGYGEIQIISDVGSGLNEDRKGFLKLLDMVSERKVSKVIVVYEDRLTRFGFETLRKAFLIIRNRNRGDKPRGEDAARRAC